MSKIKCSRVLTSVDYWKDTRLPEEASVLKVRPIRRADALRYPDKDDALAHPELLERLPARWRACRQAVAAVGLLMAVGAASGCRDTSLPDRNPSPSINLSTDDFVMYAGAPTEPPVLGEAEAMAVIERIMKEYLPNVARNVDVDRNSIVYLSNDYSPDGSSYEQAKSVTAGSIDLFDEKTGIGLEYIGSDDRWEGITQESTANPEQNRPNVLLVNGIYEGTDESDIRAMIKDFLTWLKAEGIG